MTTAERMKARRKELGMTAEFVAEKLGYSPATVYRWERGDIEKMPMDILTPLAQVLHTTPAYLMGWDDAGDDTQDSAPCPTRYTHVKIAGRDGTLVEKDLTDADAELLLKMIERLPDAGEDL